MAYEQREGQGALFKNNEKSDPKHPDYRGDMTVGGAKFWLAAWIKEGKNGKFMSVQAKPKEEKTPTGVKHNPGPLEDIPF